MSVEELAKEPCLDDQMIAELRDLLGDEFSEMVELFLETATVNLEGMQLAMAAADSLSLREHAHGLKGACQNIGALRLARACALIEGEARLNRLHELEPLLATASCEAQTVRAQLASLV